MDDFFAKSEGVFKKIKPDEVYYFTKNGSRVVVRLIDSSISLSASSLYQLNSLMNKNQEFFRCHKSFVVNINKIHSIIKFANKTFDISFIDIAETIPITSKNLKVLLSNLSVI